MNDFETAQEIYDYMTEPEENDFDDKQKQFEESYRDLDRYYDE